MTFTTTTNNTDGDPLLKKEKPDCTNGLVVALHDAIDYSLWSSGYENITGNWLSHQNSIYSIGSLGEEGQKQGYANTKALEGYNESDRVESNSKFKVLPVGIIAEYAKTHLAPTNSSGWYWPSIMELKHMCWGQQENREGVVGRDMLNAQLGKLGIPSLQSDRYWSSTEGDDDDAWYVDFTSGSVSYYRKHFNWYGVRAVLAF